MYLPNSINLFPRCVYTVMYMYYLPRRVSLVVVKPSLHTDNRFVRELAKHQVTSMAFH